MKIRVELSITTVGNNTVLHCGDFNTDNEEDGELFLDLMDKAVLSGDDFGALSIRRIDNEGAQESTVQGSNLA